MLRIIEISLNEIAIDPVASSERIDVAAGRQGGMTVSGLGLIGDRVMLFLEEQSADAPGAHYRFAPFDGTDCKDIIGEAGCRYAAGFSIVGVFAMGESFWGLFRQNAQEDEA